ncbi:MAG: hypothetical protein U0414_37595 [Polyangiaceae bacterium]
MDLALYITLVVALAAFVTAHVGLSLALTIAHKPRWRGALALFVPPLAPVWGFAAKRRVASVAWCAFLAIYVAARIVAAVRD